jgi:hypothetical protein
METIVGLYRGSWTSTPGAGTGSAPVITRAAQEESSARVMPAGRDPSMLFEAAAAVTNDDLAFVRA